MSEICVFAGTTEGRRLLEFLAGQDLRALACVATEYGETLVPRAENIAVSDVCTNCHSDLLWSHRATKGKRGTMSALMCLV